jgi:hypothetical protein
MCASRLELAELLWCRRNFVVASRRSVVFAAREEAEAEREGLDFCFLGSC